MAAAADLDPADAAAEGARAIQAAARPAPRLPDRPLDRANEQAANSLLKILEEPPAHLMLFMTTAENAYDLLPTIRSRSLIFRMSPLRATKWSAFVRDRGLKDSQRRIALAGGSPGSRCRSTWMLTISAARP